jgi:hypothetical protein
MNCTRVLLLSRTRTKEKTYLSVSCIFREYWHSWCGYVKCTTEHKADSSSGCGVCYMRLKATFDNIQDSERIKLQNVTKSTELSPSWEPASYAAIQEFPAILWYSKVRYHVHKSPPMVTTAKDINPVNITQSFFSTNNFSIIHWNMFWSS